MAIALVQQQQSAPGGSVSTMPFTLGAAPTNGNMLVCMAELNDSNPTLAGTGVTWTRRNFFSGDASHDNCALWTGVVGASASVTQTISFGGGANTNQAAIMAEFSGVQQVVDGTPPTPTDLSSATPSITSNAPTVSGDLAVAFMGQASAIAPTATPSGWNTLTAATNTRRVDAAWLALPSSSAVSAQWTYAASKFALAEIVLIKATSVATLAPPFQSRTSRNSLLRR